MTVSIIIPCFNRIELTTDCLASLVATDADVIIIDNGSTDETREVGSALAKIPCRTRWFRNETNLGFAAACNQGAAQAFTDHLVFLNNDTLCHDGWLDALVAPLEDPAVGITGARLMYPHGLVQHAGVTVDFDRGYGHEACNITVDLKVGDYDVAAVTGACLAIRRSLFDELGGFDEEFRNGYEDIDLCLRASQAGWLIRYVADAHVTHLESQTAGRFDHVNHNIDRLRSKWGGQ